MGGGGGGYSGGIGQPSAGDKEIGDRLRNAFDEETTCIIFVPHAWTHDREYQQLMKLLEGDDDFAFRDYSVPKDRPIEDANQKEIEEAIERKIKYSSVVLIPAGMYVTHSDWIKKEIEIAKRLDKPIVAVKPWGGQQIPVIVQENANEIVGWQHDSIVDAIKRNRKAK